MRTLAHHRGDKLIGREWQTEHARRIARSFLTLLILASFALLPTVRSFAETPFHSESLIFPLNDEHNHAPGIVECPDGSLLVSWYRGAGERKADDVRVLGAWRPAFQKSWTEPFLLADNPDFPDCNTTLFIDRRQRLWLFWPVILANSWESCLTQYRRADTFTPSQPLPWTWQGTLTLRPVDFSDAMLARLDERLQQRTAIPDVSPERVTQFKERIADKLSQRLGWQPRCKPIQLPSGRILLPLYSDTYSVSLIAISDDDGATWRASRPLAGFGNIQPTLLRRDDGTIVAYMRENGPLKKIRVGESRDDGMTWGPIGTIDLPNPGAGIDGVRLQNGHWLLVYNDTTSGRNQLAMSLSTDEGRSWEYTRHLEKHESGQYHYPAVIQAKNGRIHVVYSYFVAGGKSMKHAEFDESWVTTKP